MAAIDFPNSPTIGDVFTAGNSSYRWTGVAWVSTNIVDLVDLGLGYGDVDGGNATAWYSWLDLKIDNSDASVVFLDGVYVDGGNSGSF